MTNRLIWKMRRAVDPCDGSFTDGILHPVWYNEDLADPYCILSCHRLQSPPQEGVDVISALPCYAMSWSVICDLGSSWSYSLFLLSPLH